MLFKNKDGLTHTALVDTVISALQMEGIYYGLKPSDKDIIIVWDHHKVRVKGECIWFDGKRQHSVYNIINCIKAGN